MNRLLPAACLALLPLAACAAQPERLVEAGVPRGSLAVAAIDKGDLAAAERQLADSSLEAGDPARLINLGTVYLRQGRTEEAASAWRRALTAHDRTVATADGRMVGTAQLAREALARLDRTSLASR